MKLIIISDNHNNIQTVKTIKIRHFEEADLFIHCGDSQLYYDDKVICDFLRVGGNCDYDRSYPKEVIEKIDDRNTLFITHGHHYDVKYSLERLHYKALELGANIVCYGHSHCVNVEEIDGIIFINPGSVVFPRNTREKTYASLTIEDNLFKVEILDVSNGKILMKYEFKR